MGAMQMVEAVTALTWGVLIVILGAVAAIALQFAYVIVVGSVFSAGFLSGVWSGRVVIPALVDRGLFPLIRRGK